MYPGLGLFTTAPIMFGAWICIYTTSPLVDPIDGGKAEGNPDYFFYPWEHKKC